LVSCCINYIDINIQRICFQSFRKAKRFISDIQFDDALRVIKNDLNESEKKREIERKKELRKNKIKQINHRLRLDDAIAENRKFWKNCLEKLD